jgi:ribonuclease III
MSLKNLEKNIGVSFNNKNVLENALIHRSWINENRSLNKESNERLEFLGDAILEFWTTKRLFILFPELPEGALTNIRASIVCTDNLAEKSVSMKLGKHLLLSKGEERNGGRDNPSILADLFESIIGAIYVDLGLFQTEKFLSRVLLEEIKKKGSRGDIKDAKTKFQEVAQSEYKTTPIYKIIKESGPDHQKSFQVGAYLGNKKISQGKGLSKRSAEEEAAQKALTIIKNQVQ